MRETFFHVLFFLVLLLVNTAGATERSVSATENVNNSFFDLQVVGNKIIGVGGKEVLLRGVNIEDPKSLKEKGHFTEDFFSTIVNNWHANVVRVPIYPASWSSSYIDSYLVPLNVWAKKYKSYLIFDYHDFGNPASNINEIRTRWQFIVSKFSQDKGIIYDIFNEPHLPWDQWKVLAESMVDDIRIISPTAIIMVGGINWGYDLKDVRLNPVQRDNIIYSTHPYPSKKGPWEDDFGYLVNKAPVIAGEWGFTDEWKGWDAGVYYIDPLGEYKNYGEDLVKYFDLKGIHWTAWVMCPEWHPNLITDWNYTPTRFGQLVKNALGENDGRGK